ncbi:hypothetical protein VPHD528_0107 [Vibrio phage D528]
MITFIAAIVGLVIIHAANLITQQVYIINRPEKHENLITASLKCDYVALSVMFLLGIVIFIIELGVFA